MFIKERRPTMDINIKDLQNKYGEKAKTLINDDSKLKNLIEVSIAKIDGLDKSVQLEKLWQRLMLLFGLIKDWANGSYPDVPKNTLVIIVISLIYLVNPFDLIPDVLPVVGYIDDIAVFALVIKRVNNDLDIYESWINNRDLDFNLDV